jgi:hypothetical protein
LAQAAVTRRTGSALRSLTIETPETPPETPMSDLPPDPEPTGPPPYPEITPNPGYEEAPQTSPTPQEDDTGRPHDAGPRRQAMQEGKHLPLVSRPINTARETATTADLK